MSKTYGGEQATGVTDRPGASTDDARLDDSLHAVLTMVERVLRDTDHDPADVAAQVVSVLRDLPAIDEAELVMGENSYPTDTSAGPAAMTWPLDEHVLLAVRLRAGGAGTALPAALGCLAGAISAAGADHAGTTGADSGAATTVPLDRLAAMQDRIVGDFVHSLSTPLTSVVAYAGLLADPDSGALNDTQRQFLEVLERNAARLMRLLDELPNRIAAQTADALRSEGAPHA